MDWLLKFSCAYKLFWLLGFDPRSFLQGFSNLSLSFATRVGSWQLRFTRRMALADLSKVLTPNKLKQKETSAKRMFLPSVKGKEGANRVVIDFGSQSKHNMKLCCPSMEDCSLSSFIDCLVGADVIVFLASLKA
ncbi:hypothetical protein QVD17_16290 [Tagetes erecta]|uniref:Uncharacterized protein n=1 Tax=Tagetes erecta TaxID=13708 RepID=A0AAD8KWI0_TARER|nr:hypothetical protein QVD17_16290 [Tagetes erecta]